ncbi:spermine synthase, partial [bacterium]|nr:spermine synthase [bacterium]
MVEYSHTSPHHVIRVADFNGVRTLRFERNQQSSMRLDDPFDTDIEYVGYLHLTVAVRPQPQRALVIGLGGGTFVKQLWRDHPQLQIDAVEIDAEVAEVARELFGLPDDPRIAVHVAEGRAFLEASTDAYDIIVVDAYNDDTMPLQLTTEQFMQQARGRLAPDGVIAYNVIGAVSGMLSKPLRRLHKTAANVWRTVWLFQVASLQPGMTGPENIVLLASDAELSKSELAARIRD